ncbi:hypothetical protein OESDEN_17649 [Oesophagostomum dentatum]|uniref:Uncharacterized protein n=1 Tax=Oesophagostomum dentatum TaxID=61180 RepID=A0A0B1SGN1_OESDE|nr:hypothetical protein OESDEN_17649 [Oesophagostomum dentatum]
MALMERDKARKQEILEKNHAVASRLSANSSRKNYAFGSSTPRELSFLDPRILKMNAMEKRYSPDNKNSPPNGPVNARRGRSMASMLSTSMFVSTPERTPDRTRQTASITRLAQPKTAPSKAHNSMTQSVYHPSPNPPTTPTARPRRKMLNQITNSAPHPVHTGSAASAPNRKTEPKPKTPSPRGTPTRAVSTAFNFRLWFPS